MSVHARAPVRIDFAGGWSDVPDFADLEGGAVVNAAINLHVHVECLTRAEGGGYRLHAEDIGERVFLRSAVDIEYNGKLDIHKAALNMLPVTGGVEIITSSDVPAGSGLGGSGALDVALLQALALCRREKYEALELAELGFQLEARELKLAGGRQDQYAAALGGFHELLFGADDNVRVRPLDLDSEVADDLSNHVALVYTGQSHFSSKTHDRVWESYRSNRGEIGDAVRAMRDLVAPLSDALEAREWREVARLVDENWRQQQRLDATICTEGTQKIEAAARHAGAWGIKATGAGAGGCLVVLGPPDRQEEIHRATELAGGQILNWSFDPDGVTGWRTERDADNGPS